MMFLVTLSVTKETVIKALKNFSFLRKTDLQINK